MREITDDEFDALIESGKVLVDFYSTWCQPCKPLTKVLESIEPDFPDITFVKINVDEQMRTASFYGVGALPTLILFEDGNEVKQNLGAMPEPALRAWLKV